MLHVCRCLVPIAWRKALHPASVLLHNRSWREGVSAATSLMCGGLVRSAIGDTTAICDTTTWPAAVLHAEAASRVLRVSSPITWYCYSDHWWAAGLRYAVVLQLLTRPSAAVSSMLEGGRHHCTCGVLCCLSSVLLVWLYLLPIAWGKTPHPASVGLLVPLMPWLKCSLVRGAAASSIVAH